MLSCVFEWEWKPFQMRSERRLVPTVIVPSQILSSYGNGNMFPSTIS